MSPHAAPPPTPEGPPEGPMVTPVHTRVPGRARFRIEGLRGGGAITKLLEERLSRTPDVLRVTASELTGTILVQYNSGNSRTDISAAIRSVLETLSPEQKAALGSEPDAGPRPSGGPPPGDRVVPVHEKVPGRTRYHVPVLCEADLLKTYLEFRLAQQKDILQVSANAVTGTVLVRYNSGNSPRSIGRRIGEILAEGRAKIAATETAVSGGPAPDPGTSPLPASLQQILRFHDDQPERGWHRMEEAALLALLEVDAQAGLSLAGVREKRLKYGPNTLPSAKPRSGWSIFFDQLNSLPVYLLGAAAGLSVVTGGVLDAALIMGVVVANAAIGYVMESQSEKTISALQRIVYPSVAVVREGEVAEVSVEEIVPGDLLILKPGTYVSADCRVLAASRLTIDESTLTGESMPVNKSTGLLRGTDVPLADRSNMAYMGTLVSGGEGVAVAVSTGMYTEMGRIQSMLDQNTSPETPIQRQLRELGDHLILSVGAVGGFVFLVGLFRGYGMLRMLKMAISMAAAAVPEGLPTAATVTFTLGIRSMEKHHLLVRRLQAVETLGAVQTLCMDKTGTITRNRMAVKRVVVGLEDLGIRGEAVPDIGTSEDFHQFVAIGVLCNDARMNGANGVDENGRARPTGSPTECALLDLAVRAGCDVKALRRTYPLLEVRHRAENRLFMSTIHEAPDGGRLLAVKGSPADLLNMCDRYLEGGASLPLDESVRLEIELQNARMAGEALRVLGAAFKRVDEDGEATEEGMTWAGLIGMADPIRPGVGGLIETLHRAGIDTVMITGDQSQTAYAVAREVGLSRGESLEILDVTQRPDIDDGEMEALAPKVHVFSRITPAQKLKIVKALQSTGKVVAMTGDGVNDGPALKAADIGIAMGRSGTDVARDVADVVIEKDDLETIVIAIRDGRTIGDNIKKSVHFFLATNLSEVLIMAGAIAGGLGSPLNTMQLLWINMISDILPGVALSMEQPEGDVLARPPRAENAPLFSPEEYKRMAFESAAITGGALAAYGYGLARYGFGAGAGSLAFQSLTIGQLLHAFSCRSKTRSIFSGRRGPSNPYLTWSIGGSLALQGMTFFIPGLRNLLGITAPSLPDILVAGGTALAPFLINEATKTAPPGGGERISGTDPPPAPA